MAVANAKHIALSLEHVDNIFEIIKNQPPETTASTQGILWKENLPNCKISTDIS